MNLSGKDIAAIAHNVALLLSLAGVIGAGAVGGTETAIAAGITAGCGLASSAVVLWKYIHHHGEKS